METIRLWESTRACSREMLAAGKALLGGLLDLALPPLCLVCRTPVGSPGTPLCDDCHGSFPFLQGAFCPGCGEVPAATPFEFCPACRHQVFQREGLVALASFRGGARDLIHALKYRGDLGAGRFLSRLLGRKVLRESAEPWDAVVPVPLHRSRLRARGFNQAVLLARGVGRAAGIPMRAAVLVRSRNTAPLSGLSRRSRAREIRGSIRVRPGQPLGGGRFLLVDDVVTSGATVEECARCLREAGAASVMVAAAARKAGGGFPHID